MTDSRCKGCSLSALCEPIQRAASSSSNVLVVGEDGTGKDFAARTIHRMSSRASGPFVVLAAGALRPDDVEDQLFGDDDDRGKLAAARGGTLFLDEVADIPLRTQARLVRVLDRLDGLDVRIVASTQHDLAAAAREGRFRVDLFHRLSVVKLELLPLRKRTADVPMLARALLLHHAAIQRKNVRSITADAMELLTAHSWPGNVRELSNVIEQAVVLATKDAITSEDLACELREARTAQPAMAAQDDATLPNDLEDATRAFQKRHVARVLASCGGHRARAARLLGVSPATFFRHLRKLDLSGTNGSSDHHA